MRQPLDQEQTDRDASPAQRVEQPHAYWERLQLWVAQHAALAGRLQALHERFLLLQDRHGEESLAERRAKRDEILSEEVAVVARAKALCEQMQRHLNEHRRWPRIGDS